MSDDRARRRLAERAVERGYSLATLSALVGRNAAYLQQYIKRGTPAVLPEDTRRNLAMCLDIDERELGARDPWSPPRRDGRRRRRSRHGN